MIMGSNVRCWSPFLVSSHVVQLCAICLHSIRLAERSKAAGASLVTRSGRAKGGKVTYRLPGLVTIIPLFCRSQFRSGG